MFRHLDLRPLLIASAVLVAYLVFAPMAFADEYDDAFHRAVRENKTLVVFVNCQPSPVPNYCVAVRCADYNGSDRPRILDFVPDGKGGMKTGRAYAVGTRFEGEPMASPFHGIPFKVIKVTKATADGGPPEPPEPPEVADGSPYLSSLETKDIKATWPKELPWRNTFYRLPPRYQNLYTMGGGSFKGRDATDIHDHESAEFTMSGGMVGVRGWTSWKRLDLPAGSKVKVWEEAVDVRAFALVPRWRWSFPDGTVAYDALFNADGKPFEIRTATKRAGDWKHEVAWKDAEAVPVGYRGLGRSCASCHDTTGQIMSVPGRIYLRERWGSDARFSWRPYDENAKLDHRWPLELQ